MPHHRDALELSSREPAAACRGGLGLPIIGKLLGHTIGGRIAAALDGKRAGSVVQLKGGRRR
jgi:hypothetical protein